MALVVKNLAANAGDLRDAGLIPVLGRSPGEGQGNPLQYSCLENPMDRGAWWATVHRVTKSQTQLKQLSSSNLAKVREQQSWGASGSYRADLSLPCGLQPLGKNLPVPLPGISLRAGFFSPWKNTERHMEENNRYKSSRNQNILSQVWLPLNGFWALVEWLVQTEMCFKCKVHTNFKDLV